MPEEIRHARWLLKERDEFLAQARREADDIIESARVQAERMVERTEIAREARRVAQKTVDDADAQARRLRLECEDYIDHKLAEFEVVLERTMAAVQKGRDRLQVTIDPLEAEEPDELRRRRRLLRPGRDLSQRPEQARDRRPALLTLRVRSDAPTEPAASRPPSATDLQAFASALDPGGSRDHVRTPHRRR